jgi:hypothetical protein
MGWQGNLHMQAVTAHYNTAEFSLPVNILHVSTYIYTKA